MSNNGKHLYEFDSFLLDAKERCLVRDGALVPIPPKAFDVLLVLIQNSGHLVEKDALIKKIWPDSFVEEGNLSFNISVIRKALGDSSTNPTFIETVPKRGYRFIARVIVKQNGNGDPLSEDPPINANVAENKDSVVSSPVEQWNNSEKEPSKQRSLRIPLILGTVFLLCTIIVLTIFWPNGTAQINNISILTTPTHRQEFFVRIDGKGFNINTIQIVVIGAEGCPRVDNCVVPNNVLHGVSNTQIESVPLTLDAGDFKIYVRNGSTDKLSNGFLLTVNPPSPSINISVDGHPHDWAGITPLLIDSVGDGPFNPYGRYYQGQDFIHISITNDNTTLFFLLEFAGDYTGGIKLFMDTDIDASTGCDGAEYIIFVWPTAPGANLALADGRNCTFKDDFPGAVISEAKGRFVEASVPLDKLRVITPNTVGVRISAKSIAPGIGKPDDVGPPATYLFK